MDILKLVLVFCVIIGVMWMKKPMWMAVIAASVATIFLYGLSPDVAVHGIIKGATARATVETLVVFYSITFLQRMMEKRKNLSNAQVAMNGLFNNNRVNASIVPFLLGMLPAASMARGTRVHGHGVPSAVDAHRRGRQALLAVHRHAGTA